MSDPLSQQQQLQYLEAMGITLWTSRYVLPNALPIEACDWPIEQAKSQSSEDPSRRIQNLLKNSEQKPSQFDSKDSSAPALPTASQEVASHQAASALRETPSPLKPEETQPAESTAASTADDEASSTTELLDPLRFNFHSITLGNRWWVISPQRGFDLQSVKLLDSVLSAIHVEDRMPAQQVDFQWPMIEGFKVEDPMAEAADGMLAFAAGQREQVSPEYLLLLADDDDDNATILRQVLGIDEERAKSTLLDMPALLAPSLSSLLEKADAKRKLWRKLFHIAKNDDGDTAG